MICTYCGGTVRDGAGFCKNCGTRIAPKPPERPAPRGPYPAATKVPSHPNRDSYGHPPESYDYPNPPKPHEYPRALGPGGHEPRQPAPRGHMPPPTRGYDHPNDYDYPHYPPTRQNTGVAKAVVISVFTTVLVMCLIVAGFLIWQGGQGDADDGNSNQEIMPYATPEPPETNGNGYEDEPNIPEDTGEEPSHEENNQEEEPHEEPAPPEGSMGSERFPFPGANITRYTGNAADIMFLQNSLNVIRRQYTSIRRIETITGSFGGATQGAVVDFQLRVGLPTTGVVDETTWYTIVYKLENPPDETDPPFVPPVDVGYITLVNLHLRDGPSLESYSLGIKPVGTLVWVMSYIAADRWFFVTMEDGLAGYMKVEFLLLDGLLP